MQPVKILLVDDFEPFRSLVCSLLQHCVEFEIAQASDGLEAVQKTKELQPDLILLDVGLPGLNGIEVAKQIIGLAPRSKILFLSQDFSCDLIGAALHLGALGYVQKALVGRKLLTAIDTVLRNQQFVSGRAMDKLTASCETFHHEAQLYSEEATLVESLAELVRSALETGSTSIVIATERHRSSLRHKLASLGIEPARPEADGRLILLEATETLSDILVDRMPDASRFSQKIGSLIATATSSTPSYQSRATVFGEMVGLLWTNGDHQAAIRLEQFWNELASRHRFSLRCAYPMKPSQNTANTHVITSVGPLHSALDTI